MGLTYKPGHPRKRQVAIVCERLLAGECLYPMALIDDGISKPSQAILLLRRAGLPIVTTFSEETLTAEESGDMADIADLEEVQEAGESSKTVAFYWMRTEEIERHETDPVSQREDMRLIYRMNQVKRRTQTTVATLTERGHSVPADIARDARLPIPSNVDGRSSITAEARALIAQHQAERRARILAAEAAGDAANDSRYYPETTTLQDAM